MADARLKKMFAEKRFVIAPGVFDMISALIADRVGFDALYVTGYGTTASHLGVADAGIATYTDMIGRIAAIVAGVKAPVIADADTGYGGLLNVHHTVRGYEKAGVTAIQIEDQEFPKKCGHTPNRRVVPMADMERKIKVAVDARHSADFLVIARTDARTGLGLDEAIRRGQAYAAAGADVIFVESPESEAEMQRIGREFDKPLLANMVDGGGRTPVLSAARLQELGYAIGIWPSLGFLSAGGALRAAYGHLKAQSSSIGSPAPLYPFAEFNELIGFPQVWAFEKKWAE